MRGPHLECREWTVGKPLWVQGQGGGSRPGDSLAHSDFVGAKAGDK